MGIFDFLKTKSPSQKTDTLQFPQNGQNLPSLVVGGLKESNFIPEPTRSLVFVTYEKKNQKQNIISF